MRCWNSQSWRVMTTNRADRCPSHDGHKIKPKAIPDQSASEWRRTSWSMGQFQVLTVDTKNYNYVQITKILKIHIRIVLLGSYLVGFQSKLYFQVEDVSLRGLSL